MKRAQWIAYGGLALIAGVVVLLLLRNPPAPPLPAGEDHDWRGADACLECHDERSPNHPVGRDCARCHGSTP